MRPQTYHLASRYLHWAMAFLIFYMVFLGWTLEDKDSGLFSRYQLHKSVGFLILFLTVVRIGLRLVYKAPAEMDGPQWQRWASKSVHIGFYVLMIGLPISGWALVSTAEIKVPTLIFGLIHVPHLPIYGVDHEVFEALHGLLAKAIFYVLIPLHIGAALMHHFVHKDAVMLRILPGLTPKPSLLKSLANPRWLLPLGVVTLAFVSATFLLREVSYETPQALEPVGIDGTVASAPPSVDDDLPTEIANLSTSASPNLAPISPKVSPEITPIVPVWNLNPKESHIRFATSFQGEPIKGEFASFTADIRFDPKALEGSRVVINIDMASVNSGDAERDTTLKSSSFFGVVTHPKARFIAENFRALGKDRYLAKGSLSLNGKTRPFDLPFSLKISDTPKGRVAIMSANPRLDRLAFGVGSGEWAATEAIPSEVSLDLKVQAITKP
jgi:cytochrome b561/polyisoprenoid-binding protein YceI